MPKPVHTPKVYRFIVRPAGQNDPRSAGYRADAHSLGLEAVEQIQCQDLFFVEGYLGEQDASRLAAELLSDRLTQAVEWSRVSIPSKTTQTQRNGPFLVDVALRPGVTDPVAEQLIRAAHELGITSVERASTGQRFLIHGHGLNEEALCLLADRLLANPIVQNYALGEIQPVFPEPAEANGSVETIAIRDLSETDLLELSTQRRAALDIEEMRAIQNYYRSEQRDMTDIEFETIAQTWSEHCVHKTFRARINVQNPDNHTPPVIDNLLKTYLRTATERINAGWVRSAFVDNAGIIDFDQDHEVSFKVETHNHPSAIEPFGGANTGVGGVIRDVIGVSAKPIAATDVLCFGPAHTRLDQLPAGVLHPRRIRSGVVAGVQDYGNKIGLPTVSGAILYDPGYTANPLVFCGCVGLAPKDRHPHNSQPDDRVVVLGGRTGRDGLRGATFSSMTMDAQTGAVAGASVQIGAPIVEKGLIDVIMRARDLGLYSAITDCGAGGLSSAVGEMASVLGADVDLRTVRLKYPGLAPWEIWLSEAQERMVLAVPPANLAQLLDLCQIYAVELTDIGRFTGAGRLVVRYGETIVLNIANVFLHDGIPQRRLEAILPTEPGLAEHNAQALHLPNAERLLQKLLAHPNIASKEAVIRIYDHEVQGGTVVKPLTGARNDGPSDAVVLKPIGTTGTTALVLGAGINPEYGKLNPRLMAHSAIDEAIRNSVAVGADPERIALLDNFCWGDPKNPLTLGGLVACVQGCYEAAVTYGTPFISGKDSLNNEYTGQDGQRHAIPPTLLISSIGILQDWSRAVTMDLKQPGSLLYRVGDFAPRLGGSHLALVSDLVLSDSPPGRSEHAPQVYRALHRAMLAGQVRACHDLSEGGLAVAAAEMCIGGRLGLDLNLGEEMPFTTAAFGETNGCLLVEVAPETTAAFEQQFAGLPITRLGIVSADSILTIRAGESLLAAPLDELVSAWQAGETWSEQ